MREIEPTTSRVSVRYIRINDTVSILRFGEGIATWRANIDICSCFANDMHSRKMLHNPFFCQLAANLSNFPSHGSLKDGIPY